MRGPVAREKAVLIHCLSRLALAHHPAPEWRAPTPNGLGFRVWAFGLGLGLGLRVLSTEAMREVQAQLGVWGSGLGFLVWGLGVRVFCLGLGFRAWGLGG